MAIDARGDCNTVVSPELDSLVGRAKLRETEPRATLQFIEKLCRTESISKEKRKEEEEEGRKICATSLSVTMTQLASTRMVIERRDSI